MARWARRPGSLLLIVLCSALLAGCSRRSSLPYVILGEVEPVASRALPERGTAKPLRIAIAPVITPRDDLMSYQPLFAYLEERLGMPVQYVQTQTYAEINERMKFGEVDVALVCSYSYVVGHEDGIMELLAVPVIDGATSYASHIIVPDDSRATKIGDLRGRSFAFTDPLSYSGRLAVTYMLWESGWKPEEFFSRHIYTYSHANSIKAVAARAVDGAAVDSVIYSRFLKTNPEHARQVRVIASSPPTGMLPFVVRPGLDGQLKDKLRRAFLEADRDTRGREALRRLDVDRFVPGDDRAYDNIRRMVQEMRRG